MTNYRVLIITVEADPAKNPQGVTGCRWYEGLAYTTKQEIAEAVALEAAETVKDQIYPLLVAKVLVVRYRDSADPGQVVSEIDAIANVPRLNNDYLPSED